MAELGLGCMELEFVPQCKNDGKDRRKVRTVAEGSGVDLTAHAPYYVNLNSVEQEKLSLAKREVKAAKIGWLAGAKAFSRSLLS